MNRAFNGLVCVSASHYRSKGWNEYSEYLQGSGGFWDTGDTARRIMSLDRPMGIGLSGDAGHAGMAGQCARDLLQNRTPYGRYAFDPYGQTRSAAGIPLNVGYTGHIWDACIQQYFAPFRYYNPAAARWTMRDPLRYIDGPNMYGYAKQIPTAMFDRLGLMSEKECSDIVRAMIEELRTRNADSKECRIPTDDEIDVEVGHFPGQPHTGWSPRPGKIVIPMSWCEAKGADMFPKFDWYIAHEIGHSVPSLSVGPIFF